MTMTEVDKLNEVLGDTIWAAVWRDGPDGLTGDVLCEVVEGELLLAEAAAMESLANANPQLFFDPTIWAKDRAALLSIVIPTRLGLDGDDLMAHVSKVSNLNETQSVALIERRPRP